MQVIIFEPEGAPESDTIVYKREVPKMTKGRAALVELMRRYLDGLLDPFVTLLVFPLGQRFHKPSDKLERRIAKLILHDTPTRQRLINGVFDGESDYHPVNDLNRAMIMADEVAPLETKLKQAVKNGTLSPLLGLELIEGDSVPFVAILMC